VPVGSSARFSVPRSTPTDSGSPDMLESTGRSGNALFISHNAVDRPYAVALETAIHELLDSDTLIDVRYSTSDEAGPQGGEKWREWIHRQVVDARTALVVVTPHALAKPWLLWEAGACVGAALAQQAAVRSAASEASRGNHRLNVSIAYGLSETECPDPLRGDQIIVGENPDRVNYLLQRILQAHEVPGNVVFKAGARMDGVLQRYLVSVRTAMLQAPSMVTEANVQDWLSRIEELVRADRLSELSNFERWLMLAFGRDGEAAGVPIDVRLHRRLGELYRGRNEFRRAVVQLGLARRAAPRDIYVLRPLVEVAMKRLLGESATQEHEAGARAEVQSLLAAIRDLDQNAFVSSPDAAALYGKYLRRVERDVRGAADVYGAALAVNPNSYYLADLLAQTQLELGEGTEARATYRQALDIIHRLDEKGTWSRATAATACVALGDIDGARGYLRSIVDQGSESPSVLDSIRAAIVEVAQRTGAAEDSTGDLLAILRA
jgi:tetratricopeptide (TPR) repeat protein